MFIIALIQCQSFVVDSCVKKIILLISCHIYLFSDLRNLGNRAHGYSQSYPTSAKGGRNLVPQ